MLPHVGSGLRERLSRISPQSWRGIAALVGLLITGVCLALLLRRSGEISAERIQHAVLAMGSFALAGYLLAAFVRPLLVVISGSLFAVAAGLIWGLWLGAAIALAGSLLSSIFIYLLARRLGMGAVRELAGDRYPAFEAMAHRRGFAFVFVATLGYLLPGDLVVAVATVTGMRARILLSAALLGNVPGVILMAAIGAAVIDPSPTLWWLAGAAVILLSLVAVLLVRSLFPEIRRRRAA